MKYLLIHGHGQNPLNWNRTLSFLKIQKDFECIDLQKLNKNIDYTYKNLYKAFSEYCNQLTGQINLCGLSLGGILSLNYVLDHPEKVKSLILIGTQDIIPKTLFTIQYGILSIIPKNIFQKLGYKKREYIQMVKSLKNLILNENFNKITCDTLIIKEIKDILNKKASKRLAAKIDNSKLIIIENSGHLVNKDNPKELALQIDQFYENQV